MIEILKPGYLKEATCTKCGAVLRYNENEDVDIEDFSSTNGVIHCPKKYIICPQCSNKIYLSAVSW